MKGVGNFAAFAACLISVTALPPDNHDQAVLGNMNAPELSLIELAPEVTQWVTDEDKWALRRKGINFMDITATPKLGEAVHARSSQSKEVVYPEAPKHNSTLRSLLPHLSKDNMHERLTTFTSFHTRYYKSSYGRQSSQWLFAQANEIIANSPAIEHGASVRSFEHPWGQDSVIVQIPGRSNKTVVIGAHQDSINLFFPSLLAAPGADDDGSGTVTILEALRVLLLSDVANGTAENTIEFHWYSAEEGGLLGSQAVFSEYKQDGRDVRAMLHQDMTGYIQHTLDAGKPESMGVITDYTNVGLTDFIKKLIVNYCDIPYVLTKCGYACSDHASATKAGYPAAFVIESDFQYSDQKIHTTEDKIEYLSFDHMKQHAKLTLSLVYELAHARLDYSDKVMV